MKRNALIAISVDGDVDVHISNRHGEYATVCGMESDDPGINVAPAPLPAKAKITCHACRRVWHLCAPFKASDFE